MNEILATLLEFKEIVATLVAIFASLGVTGGGGVLISKLANKRLSKMDEKQNKEIAKMNELLTNLFNELKEHTKKDSFKNDLSNRINSSVDALIAANPKIDNAVASMFIEGGKNAYDFFRYIHETGYPNIELMAIDKRAIQVFRSLRSGYGGENNLPDSFSAKMRNEIAYPMITALLMKLDKFKSGYYNGTSDAEFLKLADWFVSELIEKSIILYNNGQHDK